MPGVVSHGDFVRFTVATLLIAILTATAGLVSSEPAGESSSDDTASRTGGSRIETTISWNSPNLEIENDEAGSYLLVPGPDSASIVLRLTPQDIFAENGNRWYIIGESRDDVKSSGLIAGQAYRGSVADDSDTRVSLYVGDQWVYGTILMPRWIGHIEPGGMESPAQKVLWKSIDMSSMALSLPMSGGHEPQQGEVGIGTMGFKVSQQVFDVEWGVRAVRSDWYDWVASAFTYSDAAWGDAGIDAQIRGIYGVGDITSSTSCTTAPSAVDNYVAWLQNNQVSVTNAYQLVTRLDLDGGCHGMARWQGRLNDHEAASVIEGLDVSSTDAYNPAHQNERGHLLIHEMAHLHGAGHDATCLSPSWATEPWYNCNIMKSPINNYDWYSLSWTQDRLNEIVTFTNGKL